MNILGKYTNGNYKVFILEDGGKIRYTKDNTFNPAFCENCDVKITDKCDGNCSFCYEGCSVTGKHGDVNCEFLNTLHPYTELAINGNDMTHPDIIPFLKKMHNKKIIINLTVNQKHFMSSYDLIERLVKEQLIYGLGISLNNPTDEFIKKVKNFPNAVIHTINGILSIDDIHRLANNDLKILILGYKDLNRGGSYLKNHTKELLSKQDWLASHLNEIFPMFKVVSFDNLAIQQLNVKNILTNDEWDRFYMGDDGDYTFYIDLVKKQFSKNSISPENERYPLMDNIDDMFNFIKEKNK